MKRWLLVAAASTLGVLALVVGTVCLTSGCSTLGYYGQAVGGHLDLLQRMKPVATWLAEPGTDERLRERLRLTQAMREFAVRELKLPDNASYRSYADLGRDAVVWNVVAAPELSLTLKTWCFPVMGCVGYRGYFDRAPADALAAQLKAEGWEVNVYGVPAYSTLGWTNWLGGDPLLNTFIQWSEGELARLIFHELAHQVAYANDDTMFNESYATAVERIGGERWLAQPGRERARAEWSDRQRRSRDFRALTLRHRERLQALYSGSGTDAEKRAGKAALRRQLADEVAELKRGPWAGFTGYDRWLAEANNASFAVQAAYNELVPAFEKLFQQQGSDFTRFHAEVQRLAALPKAERRATLDALSR